MAGLEQFHQCKSHDETDGTPFEASQNGLKHPAQTLAQATTALKRALVWPQLHTQLTRPISWVRNSRIKSFECPSTVSAQEKQILKATETLRSRQLSS